MGLYSYCVVPPDHAPAGLVGIDGAAVTLRMAAGLGVWVSEAAGAPEPAVDRIRQHNAVVEAAISEHVTPVPIRFGQWSESAEALETAMAQRAENFRKLLSLFAGALEFGVRILDPSAPPAQDVHPAGPGVSGRQYLAALQQRFKARAPAEALKLKVQEAVAPLVRAERVESQATPHGMLSFAHLVAREDFERYRSRVQVLRTELPDLRFLVSGPWPPYSFAT